MDQSTQGQPGGTQPTVQWSAPPPPTPPPANGGTFNFSDFLNFRYMITPVVVTVLYILASASVTLYALLAIQTSVIGAVIAWVLGMIWIRVLFEVVIILFRINDGIQTIARRR